MTYEDIRQRLLGTAYVAGPLLLVTSALVLVADIGRNPGAGDYGSDVEGVVGYFGFVLMVPVFLSLAATLGQWRPRLAALAAVTALLGIAGGAVMNMTLRVASGALSDVGVTAATFDALQAEFEAGTSVMMPLLLTGPLGPLAAFLLGIGFLHARQLRPQAWLLLLGGVLLPAGQLFMVATDATYTAALVLWAVALVPMGVRMLRAHRVDPPAPVTATVETAPVRARKSVEARD